MSVSLPVFVHLQGTGDLEWGESEALGPCRTNQVGVRLEAPRSGYWDHYMVLLNFRSLEVEETSKTAYIHLGP